MDDTKRKKGRFFARIFLFSSDFLHKLIIFNEISLDTPGHMDIFIHTGIQPFYCLNRIVQCI